MPSTKFIGREEEQQVLANALASLESELVAVIGRRRVGKTFLVKQSYGKRIAFEITGLQNASTAEQLQHFSFRMVEHFGKPPPKMPGNWLEAFHFLTQKLEEKKGKEKQVIFFDELPWLAGHRSKFLMGFGYFWNSWAVSRNVVVVICGSAASWMIRKVLHDRGGLYNRVTKRIFLQPFTLSETEAFLKSRRARFSRYQIVQLYMALGGIPHHLKEVEAGKSAVQNINDICFAQGGLLRDEYARLYSALFAHPERHEAVVRALASSRQGLLRSSLVKKGKLPEGGNTTRVLEELEQSGFITSYFPFGKKKKHKLYRLTDEYSLFYLKFIERNKQEGQTVWQHLGQTSAFSTWSGYAFENICLKHLPQIKKALGIAGVYALASTFFKKGTTDEKGAQIDLLIDRNDQVVNVFEIKFHQSEWTLTGAAAKKLREKMRVFREATKTRKYLMMSVIAPYGLKQNKHSLGLVEKVLTLDDLFG